jgi:CRISPR-associated protein Cmr4
MKSAMLGLVAETPLHPGASASGGHVDLPVAREMPHGFPVIPDSTLKGAFRDKCRGAKYQKARQEGLDEELAMESASAKAAAIFGSVDAQGPVSFSDGRLLLLPVRTLDDIYRWVTCPYILSRLSDDIRRTGFSGRFEKPVIPDHEPGFDEVFAQSDSGVVFLEGIDFRRKSCASSGDIAEMLQKFIGIGGLRMKLPQRLTIVNDAAFAYLAATALPVRTRNVLDDHKASKNLFDEESLPVDSVFYLVLAEIMAGKLRQVEDLIPDDDDYLRLGANETLGQGWCRTKLLERQA